MRKRWEEAGRKERQNTNMSGWKKGQVKGRRMKDGRVEMKVKGKKKEREDGVEEIEERMEYMEEGRKDGREGDMEGGKGWREGGRKERDMD